MVLTHKERRGGHWAWPSCAVDMYILTCHGSCIHTWPSNHKGLRESPVQLKEVSKRGSPCCFLNIKAYHSTLKNRIITKSNLVNKKVKMQFSVLAHLRTKINLGSPF